MASLPVVDEFAARPPPTPSELQVRLKETEERFLAIDGPLDDSRRLALWPELARLNGLLGHRADAGIAWVNALWEPSDPPPDWAWDWIETEQALPKPELMAADLDRLLANPQPSAPDLRPLTAVLVWASRRETDAAGVATTSGGSSALPRTSRPSPAGAGHVVDVARLAGGDVFDWARVRDRLLERLLAEGLGAERDLPGFLRFAGQRDGDRLRPVRERAERLRLLIHQWFDRTVEIKGKFDRTPAYVDLYFAFGMARLGEAAAARTLLRQASESIERVGTEAHTFLLQAFQYRIDQVLAGRPHAGPLPAEQQEYLEHMRQEEKSIPIDDTAGRSGSYAVERLEENQPSCSRRRISIPTVK